MGVCVCVRARVVRFAVGAGATPAGADGRSAATGTADRCTRTNHNHHHQPRRNHPHRRRASMRRHFSHLSPCCPLPLTRARTPLANLPPSARAAATQTFAVVLCCVVCCVCAAERELSNDLVALPTTIRCCPLPVHHRCIIDNTCLRLSARTHTHRRKAPTNGKGPTAKHADLGTRQNHLTAMPHP